MTNAQGNCRWAAVTIAAISMMLAAATAAPAQTFTTLASFNRTDGAYPLSGLVQGADGNLYGTTSSGGNDNLFGTIFKISTNGVLSTLYSFCPQNNCTNGSEPHAALIQGTNGDLYGVTPETVFKISLGGTLTTLYTGCLSEGFLTTPGAALIEAANGNSYGTTYLCGANSYGSVFMITPSGTFTTLHSFDNSDGAYPEAGVIQGTDRNFYGTTSRGGAYNQGTVFKMTPNGTLTTLHSFDGTDGSVPVGGLLQGTDGTFYGTTASGGDTTENGCFPDGCGTIFNITSAGALTTLHFFAFIDGAFPFAALIQATDGNLYGTTPSGGAGSGCDTQTNCGTAFALTPSGTLTTLHSFCEGLCSDGAYPQGTLVQDTNGKLYGTTCGIECAELGGYGTVFGIAVGLKPFVRTVPTSGKMGNSVIILGTNLPGATSVTFNGTPATFTIESATAIKTTVPTGATTGPVQVVTPSGTLTSNVNFQVLP